MVSGRELMNRIRDNITRHELLENNAHSKVVMPLLGVDRLSAWLIIGADIKHFTDYRYRPF